MCVLVAVSVWRRPAVWSMCVACRTPQWCWQQSSRRPLQPEPLQSCPASTWPPSWAGYAPPFLSAGARGTHLFLSLSVGAREKCLQTCTKKSNDKLSCTVHVIFKIIVNLIFICRHQYWVSTAFCISVLFLSISVAIAYLSWDLLATSATLK